MLVWCVRGPLTHSSVDTHVSLSSLQPWETLQAIQYQQCTRLPVPRFSRPVGLVWDPVRAKIRRAACMSVLIYLELTVFVTTVIVYKGQSKLGYFCSCFWWPLGRNFNVYLVTMWFHVCPTGRQITWPVINCFTACHSVACHFSVLCSAAAAATATVYLLQFAPSRWMIFTFRPHWHCYDLKSEAHTPTSSADDRVAVIGSCISGLRGFVVISNVLRYK